MTSCLQHTKCSIILIYKPVCVRPTFTNILIDSCVYMFCTILRASFMQAIEWFSRVVVHNVIFRIQFTQNRSFNSAWCFRFMGQMVKAMLTLPFGATSEKQMFPQYQIFCKCINIISYHLSLSPAEAVENSIKDFESWSFDFWSIIVYITSCRNKTVKLCRDML